MVAVVHHHEHVIQKPGTKLSSDQDDISGRQRLSTVKMQDLHLYKTLIETMNTHCTKETTVQNYPETKLMLFYLPLHNSRCSNLKPSPATKMHMPESSACPFAFTALPSSSLGHLAKSCTASKYSRNITQLSERRQDNTLQGGVE